jgi:hypothetical protein
MTTSQQEQEVDGARLMRVLADAQYVGMADSFLRTVQDARDDGIAEVVELRAAAQDRLAGDSEFLLDLARRVGDHGLAAQTARAADTDSAAAASFREKAYAEGGVLAYVEQRLGRMADTWAAERADAAADAVAFRASSTLCCAGGVALIVAGVGIAVFGPKLIGPVAEVVGPAAVVVGVVYAASCC